MRVLHDQQAAPMCRTPSAGQSQAALASTPAGSRKFAKPPSTPSASPFTGASPGVICGHLILYQYPLSSSQRDNFADYTHPSVYRINGTQMQCHCSMASRKCFDRISWYLLQGIMRLGVPLQIHSCWAAAQPQQEPPALPQMEAQLLSTQLVSSLLPSPP